MPSTNDHSDLMQKNPLCQKSILNVERPVRECLEREVQRRNKLSEAATRAQHIITWSTVKGTDRGGGSGAPDVRAWSQYSGQSRQGGPSRMIAPLDMRGEFVGVEIDLT